MSSMKARIPRYPSGQWLGGAAREFRNQRIALQQRLYEQCGDIAEFRLGVFTVQMVSSREYALEVLADRPADYMKSRGINLFARPMIGNGILSSEGDYHRRQRSLIAPAFYPKTIAGYAEVVAEETAKWAPALADRAELDLSREMMGLTLAIATRTLFHADVTGDAVVVAEALTDAMRAMMDQLSSLIPIPPPFPTLKNLRMKRAVEKLDQVIYPIIRERRRSGEDQGDVLSMLLGMKDAETGEGMSEIEIRDEVMTLFLAGHETVSNALSWSWYLLSQHPEAMRTLSEESIRVLGGRAPAAADLPNLPHAWMVLKEAMRLYPPAYMTGRRAIRDTQIGPYSIEKGSTVFVNIYSIHHRPDYFDQPESFLPERFRDGQEKQWPKGSYIPFGAGPRICIGNHMALMEGQMILAGVAQHLSFEAVSSVPPATEPLITLRPRDPLMMRVRRHGVSSRPSLAASA